ncbi:MAG: S8 family serine peptidase [Vicinamibacterales bacterium]
MNRLAGFGPGSVRAADYPGATGRGLRVAVVDSGVHPAHPHVGAVDDGARIAADGQRFTDTVDRLGHGTAVAAAIRDHAPEAAIVPVKVFDRELRATAEALEAAIDWAIGAGVDVINLSLGTANPAHEDRLRAAVARAVAAGVLLVAAGPDGGTRWLPGSLPGAVPVLLDWTCPREEVRVSVDGPVTTHPVVVRASGYPRPIPGVAPERNLKGVSFAVANATGVLCLHLSS